MMHLFARKAPSEINFLDMEAVFQRYLYDQLEELIEKGFKGKDRKEVMSAVGMQLDMEAIVNLYRLKRWAAAPRRKSALGGDWPDQQAAQASV